MKFIVGIVLFVFGLVAAENDSINVESKIIQGRIAEIQDYPYTLSLRRSSLHLGGATIISQLYAVSAARIVLGSPVHQISLRAGSNERTIGGSLHNAEQITIHPLFNPFILDNDICVIQVREQFLFGAFIQPVWLDVQGTILPEGLSASMTGWGIVSPGLQNLANELRVTNLNTISLDNCNATLSQYGEITSNMLCTALTPNNICHGDYGGPLVAQNFLIGIASWNPYCGSTHSSAFVRIAAPLVRTFIRQTTGI